MATELKRVNETLPSKIVSPEHQQAIREVGKVDRRALTDAIQAFVQYVDPQGEGSTRPDLAYTNITGQIYAPFGLNKKSWEETLKAPRRDRFSEAQLTFVQAAERSAAAVLEAGISQKKTRHEIKADLKATVNRIASLFKKIPFAEGR